MMMSSLRDNDTVKSVIRALEACPLPDLPLEIRTDSQYTIKCQSLPPLNGFPSYREQASQVDLS